MRLTLHNHKAAALALGDSTRWDGKTLLIGERDLAAFFPEGLGLHLDELRTIAPGSQTRIGPVLDVAQIRHSEQGPAYPGLTGPAETQHCRTVHILDNAAVCLVSNLPGVQEGILDMASRWSPLAALHMLVCKIRVAPGTNPDEADAHMRLFLYRVCEFLGSLLTNFPAKASEEFVYPAHKPSGDIPPGDMLPRVGAVYFIQSQGRLRRTYYLGEAADALQPMPIHPLSPLCGSITSGNYVMPSNKTCTLIHQRAPVIRALLARDGKDWNVSGVLLANEASTRDEKSRTAQILADMAKDLRLDGVIINQEGGGNADMDVMLTCAAMEKQGIACVLIVNETAGPDGRTPSLTETTPEAVSIVSAGNNEMLASLPAADAFIGYPMSILPENTLKAVDMPLTRLLASANQLGFGRYSCVTR